MAAAAYPPWVIFDKDCTLGVQGSSSSIADKNTLARCPTRTGHLIEVSLCLAAPPEGSRVCVHLPHGIVASHAVVVAAHGDSVLVMIAGIDNHPCYGTEHFVYSAGDAAAEPPRPPSLTLLRPHSIAYEDEKSRPGCRTLDNDSTGLLSRGDGEFLVAELKMERVQLDHGYDGMTVHHEAALHLLRSGSCRWRVKRPVIIRDNADSDAHAHADADADADADEFVDDYFESSWQDNDLASCWKNNMVIPVGDHILCWVDLTRGLLFSDNAFDESPSLRYVPFPVEDDFGRQSVCATADGSIIKLVNVFPRCCCGGTAGKSMCRASHVHIWTLRTDVDDMAWVMDGSLDSDQLWALDGYKGLPRVELDSPVASLDEPDAICFVICENHHEKDGDETMWRIIVDMKNKTLRSVFRYPEPEGRRFTNYHDYRYFPSRVSKYFNSKPSTGQPLGRAAQAEAMQNMMSPRTKNKLQAINSTMLAASASPEATILIALQEIPNLDRDELLKAYRILTHDDSGCRFRSLMALPMGLRKDWLLTEIKASEACVLCSGCSADMQIKE